MEQRIPEQAWQFLWAGAGGLAVAAFYDLLWGLRQELPRTTPLWDLLTGLLLLAVNVLLLLYVGDGEYRLFFPVGTAVGFALWKGTVSKAFRQGNSFFWRLFFFVPRRIWRIMIKMIKKMKIFLKNPFSNREKSVRIIGQQLCNGGEDSG